MCRCSCCRGPGRWLHFRTDSGSMEKGLEKSIPNGHGHAAWSPSSLPLRVGLAMRPRDAARPQDVGKSSQEQLKQPLSNPTNSQHQAAQLVGKLSRAPCQVHGGVGLGLTGSWIPGASDYTSHTECGPCGYYHGLSPALCLLCSSNQGLDALPLPKARDWARHPLPQPAWPPQPRMLLWLTSRACE